MYQKPLATTGAKPVQGRYKIELNLRINNKIAYA
jgi:hypothetical protein